MEQLKKMKECLTGMVESQIYGNIENVDTKELGEAVDMIKDLAEAIYYCTVTEAMEEGGDGHKRSHDSHSKMYSSKRPMPYDSNYPVEYYDPRYRMRPPMMYSDGGGQMGGGARYYSEDNMNMYPESVGHVYRNGGMYDPREGRSGQRRKMYMDGKGVKDKSHQMQELDVYMQELAADMTEMIQDASPEEKQLLQAKISSLAAKIK